MIRMRAMRLTRRQREFSHEHHRGNTGRNVNSPRTVLVAVYRACEDHSEFALMVS